jgi:hypothetical protein
VVTVSERNEVQAFKITMTDEPHFNIIKADKRSRVQDTAIAAEALLPDGPYNLWRLGETSRRVRDLAGAFAQLPHLPKMLKASAILDTLADGCEKGIFVLQLTRPDGTYRTWWMSRPDENALTDPALELVLPEAGELNEISPGLLAPKRLSGLWSGDEITVKNVLDYFSGTTVVQVDRGGYQESMRIPKANQTSLELAIATTVENGSLWLLSGPASILAEPIPAGVLSINARLCVPPSSIAAPEILPENLADAWKGNVCTGLSISSALSLKAGKNLPWKTVRDAITAALQARFIQIAEETSSAWPCDFPAANLAKFNVTTAIPGVVADAGQGQYLRNVLVASAELEPSQIQDLGDAMPDLLKIKAKTKTPVRFHVEIEMGDGKTPPSKEATNEFNKVLKKVKGDFQLR